MVKSKKEEDITDKEWEELYLPYFNNRNSYVIKYVIPEAIAFQIANSHYRNCLDNSCLLFIFNGMMDMFNVSVRLEDVKDQLVELLMIKYNLTIISEDPLVLEKWQ